MCLGGVDFLDHGLGAAALGGEVDLDGRQGRGAKLHAAQIAIHASNTANQRRFIPGLLASTLTSPIIPQFPGKGIEPVKK